MYTRFAYCNSCCANRAKNVLKGPRAYTAFEATNNPFQDKPPPLQTLAWIKWNALCSAVIWKKRMTRRSRQSEDLEFKSDGLFRLRWQTWWGKEFYNMTCGPVVNDRAVIVRAPIVAVSRPTTRRDDTEKGCDHQWKVSFSRRKVISFGRHWDEREPMLRSLIHRRYRGRLGRCRFLVDQQASECRIGTAVLR